MKTLIISILFTTLATLTMAQNSNLTLPYYQIPDPPEEYTASTVVARMVDGLGFRYYWATDGLRVEDLSFKPGDEARTSGETIEHILGLSTVILNSVTNTPNIRSSGEQPVLTFKEKRANT